MSTKTSLGVCVLSLLSILFIAGSSPTLQSVLAQPNISVESAEPASGEQDTVNLDVTIQGKGFKEGSTAWFLVNGSENPGGITVHSTRFINSRTLISNVSIAAGAVVGSFDIEVLANGRRGKGLDLFNVVEKGSQQSTNSPAVVWVNDDFVSWDGKNAKLISDAGSTSGGGSSYADGQNGVHSLVNGTSGDGIFDPDLNAKQRDIRKGVTRYVTVFLDDPVGVACQEEGVYCDELAIGAFLNVDQISDVLWGETATAAAIMHVPGGTLFFSPLVEGIAGDAVGNPCAWRVTLDTPSSAVLKVMSPSREWTERGTYHLPFQLEFWLTSCPVQ